MDTRNTKVLRLVLLHSDRTLHEVARELGTSKSTLSNIACGLYEPTDELREKVAKLFQVPAARLFARLNDEVPFLNEIVL